MWIKQRVFRRVENGQVREYLATTYWLLILPVVYTERLVGGLK